MKKIIALLQEMGFSQYEAQVYLALLQQANVSGYELAKQSGVPASKIYSILNKLIVKEMVLVTDSDPKKYVPLPPQEILSRMKGEYLHTFHKLEEKLEEIYIHEEISSDYIWNLSGRILIMRKVNEFIKEVKEHLYLSVWDEDVDEITAALQDAHQRGMNITIVHFGQKRLGLGNEYTHGREHQIRIERGGRRIALIIDDKKVILGHFPENAASNAAWTENKGLVQLAKDYIIHDIYTIRIAEKFGEAAADVFEFKV